MVASAANRQLQHPDFADQLGAVIAKEGPRGVRILTMLGEVHNGQAISNLARTFHLPPEKVELAVGVMIDDLTAGIHAAMQSPRSLAQLVELLGKGSHEPVLDAPELLGATHTQVIGNDALKVIAGRTDSKRIAQHAASFAGVSEMIAEYLLPVIAAMLVGLLAKSSRAGLAPIARDASGGPPDDGTSPPDAGSAPLQLPRVSGGVGFSGSTGGSVTASFTGAPGQYADLADAIRRGKVPGGAQTVRRVLAPIVGSPSSPTAWVARLQRWGVKALHALRSDQRS
jgi:hypothetical protein